jgi:hypothetical protein
VEGQQVWDTDGQVGCLGRQWHAPSPPRLLHEWTGVPLQGMPHAARTCHLHMRWWPMAGCLLGWPSTLCMRHTFASFRLVVHLLYVPLLLLQGSADIGEKELPAAATSVSVQLDSSMLPPKKLAQLAAWGPLK